MLNKLLLIDDDASTLRILTLYVKRLEFAKEIIAFPSADKALLYLDQVDSTKSNMPDLIFLDLFMPVVNGWDFMEVYTHRYSNQYPETKICILTSSVDPNDQLKASLYPTIISFMDKFHIREGLKGLKSKSNLKSFFY